MIHFPLLLKVSGDKQLLLIDNQNDLQRESAHLPKDALLIIDCQGAAYRCQAGEFIPLDEPISLAQLIDWVSEYACQNGHFCSAKIGAKSVSQLFEIVRYLDDQ
ncbi:DUF4144 family protein [Shewanella marisflavi]|uniref:DUF4144 family protein n=1 Tax=Shewanella marisflavi TaxID=260364 RepID=UPI003AAF1C36